MISKWYKVRSGNDPTAAKLLSWLHQMGYQMIQKIVLEQVLRVEGATSEALRPLLPLFCNPVIETVAEETMLSLPNGPVREVAYRRAMTDPEMDSFMHAAKAIGIQGIVWVRLATRYQFVGASESVADEIISRYLCNEQVQTVIAEDEEWTTLVPQGELGGVETIDLAAMDDDDLLRLSENRRLFMPLEQLQAMRRFFADTAKRPARDAEVEMIAAAWSDHCSHTTWKALGLLQELQKATREINHPLVISAFVDNSGVMRFYEGWALNMKGETHISPTFAGSPYGGIMTKHGGVIRDVIFTGQGAWPWAGTTIMATSDPQLAWSEVPEGAFHPQVVVLESIRGTKDYTNPMGIPMAWSEYLVDKRNWKGFALGHSIGVLPESRAQKGQPQDGDFVVLIGGPTGNDGLHGATVSSAKMTAETSTVDAAHVQIGMPIAERVFMEAVPVLRDADCIRACTDCGAAGLSSAVGEMGSETGVWVNLALVPLKCASMRPWQIWLSESQERGVLCVPSDKLTTALGILADYDVPASVIGVFTDTGRCQVVHDSVQASREKWWEDGEISQQISRALVRLEVIVVDLPYNFLNAGCPLPRIEVGELRQLHVDQDRLRLSLPKNRAGWLRLIKKHLGHFNIADQSLAAHQYDQTVQGATVVPCIGGIEENMPDELFVGTPVPNKPWGAGIAVATNQYWTDINPGGAARQLMAQALALLVVAGFSPDDITCCVNVYTPRVTDSPENAERLCDLVRGYVGASKQLGMPVISGKDSSSGTFITREGERIDAPLTMSVLALGRMPDASRVIGKPFEVEGDAILLFSPGILTGNPGGSTFLDTYGLRGAQLPVVNLAEFRRGLADYLRALEHFGFGKSIHSRSVVAEGGLIRRLFEMSLGSRGLGCRINFPYRRTIGEWLFCEAPSVVLAVAAERADEAKQMLGESCCEIGRVTKGRELDISWNDKHCFRASVEELQERWQRTFKEVVA